MNLNLVRTLIWEEEEINKKRKRKSLKIELKN